MFCNLIVPRRISQSNHLNGNISRVEKPDRKKFKFIARSFFFLFIILKTEKKKKFIILFNKCFLIYFLNYFLIVIT